MASSAFIPPYWFSQRAQVDSAIWKSRQTLFDRGAAGHAAHLDNRPDLLTRVSELAGKALACWCAPAPCHADELARRANAAAGYHDDRRTP